MASLYGERDTLRVPPQSVDAEQSVLGALMISATSWALVSDMLTEDDFYRREHLLAWKGIMVSTLAIPLMLLALFAMGVHSTFFGPIKYAILPQHLKKEEVLAGTGMVEAGG